MDYKEYSAEDFALDEKFQKWVLHPDTEGSTYWENWIQNNPQQKPNVNDAIELIRTAGLSADPKLNEAYLSVWKNLDVNIQKSKQAGTNSSFRIIRVAAVFVGLVACSYFLWSLLATNPDIQYQTAHGEIKKIVLTDGSRVTLNGNSILKVPTDWSKKSREVYLEGEAFFEVVRTEDLKNFEVNTADKVNVQVLGTKFNVNTRHEQVEVYLQSGKVKVNTTAGNALLLPGEFIVYQKGDQALEVKQNVTSENEVLGWKNDFFVYNDTSLEEIIKTLEDDYGYKVVVKDTTLKQKKITAKISRKDVSVLLNVLSETLDIKIVKEGNQLTFTE